MYFEKSSVMPKTEIKCFILFAAKYMRLAQVGFTDGSPLECWVQIANKRKQ
jgi:hypothetical protein